jgi:hypothetical protein
LGDCSSTTAARFARDLQFAGQTIQHAVAARSAAAASSSWTKWETFCYDCGINPTLDSVPDPIPFFLVFAVRYRDGSIAKNNHAVRGATVADVLRDIGQKMALLGRSDPRILPSGRQEFRLTRLLKGFTKADPPPERVQPVSMAVLRQLCLDTGATNFDRTTRDLAIMGFYWLCRPGEAYAPSSTNAESAPFRLCDVEFAVGTGLFRGDTIPLELLPQAQGARLQFTKQKNCNAGEKIAHGLTGDELLCPTRALARLVEQLRAQNAPNTTPLHCTDPLTLSVHARHITAALRFAARTVQHTTGIAPEKLTARSLRPGGATALLCGKIDNDTIKLVGRWQSDAMLRYLHTQAVPAMGNLARSMFQHGNFTFQPDQLVPDQAAVIVHAAAAPQPL